MLRETTLPQSHNLLNNPEYGAWVCKTCKIFWKLRSFNIPLDTLISPGLRGVELAGPASVHLDPDLVPLLRDVTYAVKLVRACKVIRRDFLFSFFWLCLETQKVTPSVCLFICVWQCWILSSIVIIVKLRLRLRLSQAQWLWLRLRLRLRLSDSGSVTQAQWPEPGANTKFGLPLTTTHQ